MILAKYAAGEGDMLMGQSWTETPSEILDIPVTLGLKLNDLRIIVNCFRAISYMMEQDDEAYLDSEAVALKARLELVYRDLLERNRDASEIPAFLKASG
jgi:hypothetical protein